MTQEELLAGYREAGELCAEHDYTGCQFNIVAAEETRWVYVKGLTKGCAITLSVEDATDWVLAHSGVIVS